MNADQMLNHLKDKLGSLGQVWPFLTLTLCNVMLDPCTCILNLKALLLSPADSELFETLEVGLSIHIYTLLAHCKILNVVLAIRRLSTLLETGM